MPNSEYKGKLQGNGNFCYCRKDYKQVVEYPEVSKTVDWTSDGSGLHYHELFPTNVQDNTHRIYSCMIDARNTSNNQNFYRNTVSGYYGSTQNFDLRSYDVDPSAQPGGFGLLQIYITFGINIGLSYGGGGVVKILFRNTAETKYKEVIEYNDF